MMEKLNWTQAQLITQFTRDWQLEWWERMAGGVAWSNKGTGKYILKKIHIDYINKEEKKKNEIFVLSTTQITVIFIHLELRFGKIHCHNIS